MAVLPDDPNIAELIRARDPEALRSVIETYMNQILRAARGTGLDPDRAEDVTQATFTTFLERAEAFEGRSHVRTWLFGILYRKVAEARREVKKDQAHDDIDEVVEQRFDSSGSWLKPVRTIETDVQSSEIRKQINGCLDTIPPRQRQAFLLREVEGFTTLEICNILEVTRTNLGILLFRGRNRLRECLEAKGVKGSHDAQV
jgi:RNA polymerase sigma-70 factor (ECF subfamily)